MKLTINVCSCFTRALLCLAGVSPLLIPGLCIADDEGLPSVVSASASIDNSDSSSFYFDSDLALPGSLRLGAGGGNNANAASRIDVKTTSYHASLATDPLKDVALGIDYEHWGEDNALLSDTWRVDFTVNLADWSLRFSPARSTITGYTVLRAYPQFDLDSDRYDAGISYFSPSDWYVTAGYTYYNYSRDVSKVTTSLRAAALLSPATLQLLSVLDQRRYSFGIGYNLADDQIGVDWSRTESALDASHYTTLSLFYSKPFLLNWAADISIGQQHASYGDTLSFANLVLNYFW